MKNKKVIYSALASISLISAIATISHSSKIYNKKQFSRQFVKNVAKFQEQENLLLDTESIKDELLNNNLIKDSIKIQFNEQDYDFTTKLSLLSTYEQKQFENIIKLQEEWNTQKNGGGGSLDLNERLDSLLKKKKRLEKAWVKQKELNSKQQKLKNIVVGVSIGAATIAGISARHWSLFWS